MNDIVMVDPRSGIFPVGLEQGDGGATLAHSFNVPGCVAAGESPEAAVERFTDELIRWLEFRASRRESVPPPDVELEVRVDEWVLVESPAEPGRSTVLFEDDLRPLTDGEVAEALRVLGDLRGLLLAQVRATPAADLERERPGGWSVSRILDELARAQWWTLSRLGASPMAEVPTRVVARLDTAMALVVQQLTALAPDRRALELELEGESWTPRKVVRRLLWLEWTLGGSAMRALELEAQPR